MYDLGLRLKETRSRRGLTQKSLARRINKSVSAVSSYESNAQMPPLDVLISIASVLNVSLDELVGFSAEKTFSLKSLNAQQQEVIELLFAEFTASTNVSSELSSEQVRIIQKIVLLFTGICNK